MGSISRYIFRITFGAFLVVLITCTTLMWIVQALRDFDLVTSQGQTILVFIGITSLFIPFLIMTIAPFALLIAVVHVLNKLSNDSEIIVMNAAGMSPWLLFRAFMSVALVVSLLVCAIAAYFGPKGLRVLRDQMAKVRAEIVGTVVQPGRFTAIHGGVIMFIRERRTNGQLLGVFIDDQRDSKERITIFAEIGELLDSDNRAFLNLQDGILQRQQTDGGDPAIIVFDRYAFDLSQFANAFQAVNYSIRERYLWQLIFPDPKDSSYIQQPGRFRAELHDRLLAPIYPPALVIIALTFLSAPRTTRQGRMLLIAQIVGWAALLRVVGMGSHVLGVKAPWMLSLPYVTIVMVFVFGSFVIYTGKIPEVPLFRYNRQNL
jgi:lipopolysaccharide export system permease protein